MIPESLKPKIWLWWPYLLGFLIFLGMIAGVLYLFAPAPQVSEDTDPQEMDRAQLRELAKPSNFVQAFIEANGGREKLDQLQSVRSVGTFESGGQSVPFRTIKRRPNRSITTLVMPDYDLSFIVNGDLVWQRVAQPNAEPTDEMKEGREADAMRELGHFFDPLMDTVLNSPEDIVSIMPNIWEGQPCLTLEFRSVSRGTSARVFIDPNSMTPIMRVEDFGGRSKREVFYSDYRPVDGGMLEPYRVETYIDDKLQNRVIVESVRANVGVIASIFEYTGKTAPQAPEEPSRDPTLP
jgi:hypothetical protein